MNATHGNWNSGFWLLMLVLVNVGPAVSLSSANSPGPAVKVEILENIPDQLSWDFDAPKPSETYYEPAFGFPVMPTRYSSKGVKVDRSFPFVLRASAQVALPKGELRILMRARSGARLFMDGSLLLTNRFPNLNADGHEDVPEVPGQAAPDIRYLRPGHFETIATIQSDGKAHTFTVEEMIGCKSRRPEPGELCVAFATGKGSFQLLSTNPKANILLTEEGWDAYEAERTVFWKGEDRRRRDLASIEERKYWDTRHALARERMASLPKVVVPNPPSVLPVQNEVDRFVNSKLEQGKVTPAASTDDYAFLRRVTLDLLGVVPSPEQIEKFRRDQSAGRRAAAIDRLLADPRWADNWVGYWQDVLAENPGILKPMLNNTGPFRWWLHESFVDNKPMDRFASELVMMEGSAYYGGPAGFGLASENDVPMAQKAQIVAQAFLGMQMQCARCHDAPYHHFKQKDLFSLAAMLKKEPQMVPLSSSIPTNSNIIIGRIVNVTLKPGTKVAPEWPLTEVMADEIPTGVLREPSNPREQLAARLTDARNERFAQVLVNRLWKRYMGWGIVEPVDDWETAKPSHPELLRWLGRELVLHDYDLKHVTRLILNSKAYQRQVRPSTGDESKPETRFFAAQTRRRLSAEQVVDAMFAAVGKPFNAEEMNLDVDGRRPVKEFNNLGTPTRSWEFTSLSNERDRPALSMPKAQSIIDTLCTFGWRESRQSPQTVRENAPNVLQPATLANGQMVNGRIARLSDDNAFTALALKRLPLPELVQELFLRVLSRPPTAEEAKIFAAQLEQGFATRRSEPSAASAWKRPAAHRIVSWSNHLTPDATRIKQELEREARLGDTPTERLQPEWREKMEDAIWTLVNTPEFVFLP
ncbi:MAG: hypothetical protein JWM16_4244 [Verrucomicrobiales bacterium]|nr:hypothetical protein [Verrucomicrobiales bacterium]